MGTVLNYEERKRSGPSCLKGGSAIRWIVIYPMDNAIHRWNNWAGLYMRNDVINMSRAREKE